MRCTVVIGLLLLAGAAGAQPAGSTGAGLRQAAPSRAAQPGSPKGARSLESLFQHPPAAARPWVFWYWLHGAVSKEGILADLIAMRDEGIGGAYLMPIQDTTSKLPFQHSARQLSPRWWSMVRYAVQVADSLGVQLAFHDADGFAVAGGPWITPELSMQKVVWTETPVQGAVDEVLAQPETNEGYYRDIRVFAYRAYAPAAAPHVSSSEGDVSFLVQPGDGSAQPGGASARPGGSKSFTSDTPCWIQYAYDTAVTIRTIVIRPAGANYQAQRLLVEVSDDGEHFRVLQRLVPPRSGWQDAEAPDTYAIPPTRARFFRFVYDKEGSEPGAEDLDAAKWKPTLKIKGITLSAEPRIDQYEGKSGLVWRVSPPTAVDLPAASDLLDISSAMDAHGHLRWQAPPGTWTILRMGYTTTGHTNATGGGGRGLECDKFNPAAARIQFNHWFGAIEQAVGPARKAIRIFHVDSWECGDQNWSPVFAAEFRKRRGYDLLPYLPVMAGIPVRGTGFSEHVLSDVRQTISELVNDAFFHTMATLAHAHGCQFSAESVAPVVTVDNLLHNKTVDLPMGEFWLRSPTHDKPLDVLDAVSGGHIYGKPIIQSEAFTELRLQWDEYPGMLKTLQDRNYAWGVNRLVFHVFMHNPWMDRRPGVTLDGVGLFFQRDQTWWKPGKAWVDYTTRCQALLQWGKPVVDVAVYTGDNVPSRSVLPDRLCTVLPGLIGDSLVALNTRRLTNTGVPLVKTSGVQHVANIADAADWVNPLHGYAYDCFNADVLAQARVSHGRVVLPSGASYGVLVFPPGLPSQPDTLSSATQAAITRLSGAHILQTPWTEASLTSLGLPPDVTVVDPAGRVANGIAYTHRTGPGADVYFISNQEGRTRDLRFSLRSVAGGAECWDPVTGRIYSCPSASVVRGRTELPLRLDAGASVFVVLRAAQRARPLPPPPDPTRSLAVTGPWTVTFDTAFGGPTAPLVFPAPMDWSLDPRTRYYSGTAVYSARFSFRPAGGPVWLDLGRVADVAGVRVNGLDCGVAWTAPFRVDITRALRPGENHLEVEVTNTWANRIIGDHLDSTQHAWTNAPYRLDGKLLPSGLLGPVQLRF
ncbi:glycosyl hydrolase [Dinghuibacter silviterrae]|uniref:Alpha-L-rhamnosidase-like protein n=1 Tax=Dinghuibacter silviterrae TaxID=1539049 RepID=A0A4R8DW11_9BACT|nr:glycosyl hydrolase [Dinghuibacter silviterrae]TDX01401.1 alpha-L-rhamnosidase-like protein [Dinghuibacter silviterrae]